MAYTVKVFSSPQGLEDYLNDVVVGSKDVSGTLSLTGLTVVINSTTITFLAADTTLNAVVARINASEADAATIRNYTTGGRNNSKLAFDVATTTIGDSGTANALLGLHTSGGDRTVGASAIASTDIIDIEFERNKYILVHK